MIATAAFLLSCARGGAEHAKPGGPVFEVEGVFTIGKPGDGWKLHRNRRIGKKYLLDYRREDADVDVRVSVNLLDETSKALPLPTLAEGLVLHYGRSRGLETEVHAVQRVDFRDHEGFVVHATRRWRPNVERRMAQVFVRTNDRIVMVTYIAPPELYERFAPDFAHALDNFAVLLPPEAPVFGLKTPDDLPQRSASATDPGKALPVTTPPPPK